MAHIPPLYLQRLGNAAGEFFAHLILTLMALGTVAVTAFVLKLLGLDLKVIPILNITLGQWMFDMDVVAATLINMVGLVKALVVYGTS